MIISKTPFRLGLFGGGTDLPDYANIYGGAVLNLTIDKYVYVTLHEKFENGVRLSYSSTENASDRFMIKHPIVRNALGLLDENRPLEITSISEIPSYGSGLGSSSSFTVGLLSALNTYQKNNIDAVTLAEQACYVEVDLCEQRIGKQDQFAAAIGGVNFIQFNQDRSVLIEPIQLNQESIKLLFSHFLFFYTGITRSANELLYEQQENLKNDTLILEKFHTTKELAFTGAKLLRESNIEALGKLLNDAWNIKKGFSSDLSTDKIDSNYRNAISRGAFGGKLLGAGGGGFFLYVAPPEKHELITKSQEGYRRLSIDFEPKGSRIIFNN
jgi:D-glycero-alpha-D-manno-heptose-7-phosphate kinase